jgi:thiaminase
MKRFMICFMVTVSSVSICSEIRYDSSTNQSTFQSADSEHNASYDEYTYMGNQDVTEEYEQHVCDQAKPPKISAVVAFLTHVGGSLFYHYVMIQTLIGSYFAELKQIFKTYCKTHAQKNYKKR